MKLIHTNTNNIKKSLLYIFPIIAVTTFTLALTVIYNIYSISNSSAINPSTGTNVFTVSAGTSLGVSVADSTTLDIQPTSGGAFSSTPLTVYVETDNEYGYTLSMTTTTPNLKRTTPLSDGTVPTIETLASGSSFTSDTFTTNRWGYTLDNTNYYAIPGSVIINPSGTSGNYEDNPNVITFAAKLDNATPSGNYLTTINFIATAKTPTDLSGFDAAFIFADAEKLTHNGESYYAMQDLTYSVCSYVATPSSSNIDSYPTVTVFDNRDYEKYTIGKLADGNCWLLDNLRLGASSIINQLSTSNTNMSPTISFTLPTSSDSCLQATQNCDSSGNASHTGYTVPALVSSHSTVAATSYGKGSGKVGVFYNFCAATSGTYCEPQNSEASYMNKYDICPKNWKIPDGTTNNTSYYNLYQAYNNTTDFNATFSSILSGYLGYKNWAEFNKIGIYTTTTLDTENMGSIIHMNTSDSTIYPVRKGFGRYAGGSVRCVSRQTISDLTYMQDFASLTDTDKTDVINSMLPETTYTLKDKRDNQDYTIAKLKDGKVWMTKNLNLAGGTALYSDTSDVPSGYPSSASTPYYILPDSVSGTDNTDFTDNSVAYVTNTNSTTCGSGSPCYSYYSWLAATAGGKHNGEAITAEGNINADYSICPSGWKLPTSNGSVVDNSDFYQLATAYGMTAGVTYENTAAFNTNAGPGTTANFLRAGDYLDSTFDYGGSNGYYWSATSSSSGNARHLGFSSGDVSSANNNARRFGFSVRCLLK